MNGEIKKRRTAFKVSIGIAANGKLELERDAEDPTKERFRTLIIGEKEINRINLIANVIDNYQNPENTFAALTIDDGTGNMRIRAFSDSMSLIKDIQLGTTILIIGTLRYFNNELYILPEIIKELDPRWLLARKLELEKEFGDAYKIQSQLQPQSQPQLQSQPQPQPPTPTPPISQPQSSSPEPIPQTSPVQPARSQPEPEIEIEKIEDLHEDANEEVENEKSSAREEILKLIREAETEQGIDIDKVIMQLNQRSVDEIKNTITELLEGGEIFEPQPGRLRIL